MALAHGPTSPARALYRKADRLPYPTVLRHRPRPPSLRVPHHTPRGSDADGFTAIAVPVHIHLAIRLLRYVPVLAHR